MKKTLLVALLACLSVSFTHAQSLVKVGIKGGLLLSTSDIKYHFNSGGRDYKHSSTNPGFEVGVQVRVGLPVTRLLLQSEIVYNRTTGSFDTDPAVIGADQVKIRSNAFDVPVLVGWKFSVFRLMAGPSFRFPIDQVYTTNDERTKIAPRLKNFVLGFQVGLGADLGRLTIDVRYCGNFTNLTDKSVTDVTIDGLKATQRKVAISIGYMFLR